MNISVIGTGYVGLVSGACLAELGHRVICVDIDPTKVDALNAGRCPIFEEGLPVLIERNVDNGRLSATTCLATAVNQSELSLVAAPTPFDGKRIDLSYIKQIAEDLGRLLKSKKSYHCVVIKSTVVPGTTDDVVRPILEQATGLPAGETWGLGMNPEFLSEGVAVRDFMRPDRLVFGGIDERSQQMLETLYASFKQTPKLRTNNRTAEMIKYASNSLQATLISFSNEIATLCATQPNLDACDVMKGVHLMNEITPVTDDGPRVKAPIARFLSPGCGFGGSCFPKDVSALAAHGAASEVMTPLLDAVLGINKQQPLKLVQMAEKAIGSLAGKRVAVLGIAFKSGTDDVRESPALAIVDALVDRGAIVRAFDPQVKHLKPARDIKWAVSTADAVRGSDVVLLVTAWPEFKSVPALIEKETIPPVLIDGRRFISPAAVKRYAGIGLKQKGAVQ
ncbi:MAG TPA: UDP-glucose/GDP-mannose dehydrogenase family protein [Tepidisphaeraceae bacterium]|jgi:UDPglucose 6-dehydrogenase/GDP-mannose 6-dehydrogenase